MMMMMMMMIMIIFMIMIMMDNDYDFFDGLMMKILRIIEIMRMKLPILQSGKNCKC